MIKLTNYSTGYLGFQTFPCLYELDNFEMSFQKNVYQSKQIGLNPDVETF